MKSEQWQEHIAAYLKTNQSKRAYAKQHNLVYSQFLYWFRKHSETSLSDDAPKPDASNAFVRVTAQSHNPQLNFGLGVLEFPEGIRLVIHHADLLPPLLTLCLGRSV